MPTAVAIEPLMAVAWEVTVPAAAVPSVWRGKKVREYIAIIEVPKATYRGRGLEARHGTADLAEKA